MIHINKSLAIIINIEMNYSGNNMRIIIIFGLIFNCLADSSSSLKIKLQTRNSKEYYATFGFGYDGNTEIMNLPVVFDTAMDVILE